MIWHDNTLYLTLTCVQNKGNLRTISTVFLLASYKPTIHAPCPLLSIHPCMYVVDKADSENGTSCEEEWGFDASNLGALITH